jgi:hypothetical protein
MLGASQGDAGRPNPAKEGEKGTRSVALAAH